MLTIKYQTTFKKDYKRIVKRGYDIRKRLSPFWLNKSLCRKIIEITTCLAIMPVAGSAISPPIGF